MQAWEAWVCWIYAYINVVTTKSAYDAMGSGERAAWEAVAALAATYSGNDYGIADQAVLNLHMATESGAGTADFTFTVVDGAITNVYIDNLVVDESKASPLA